MKKIVIVDDDYGVQDVVQLIFGRSGYNTIVLVNPEPLYEHKHDDANIILLDRHLGNWDGLEVCKQLRTCGQFANTPILVMSASKCEGDDWFNANANGFIEKPFHKNDLLKQIHDLLEEKTGVCM